MFKMVTSRNREVVCGDDGFNFVGCIVDFDETLDDREAFGVRCVVSEAARVAVDMWVQREHESVRDGVCDRGVDGWNRGDDK